MVTTALLTLSLLSLSPKELLQKADQFRSPTGGFEVSVDVQESSGDKSTFKVYLDGQDFSLMTTEFPPKDRGRNLLMMDREMWVFIPNIRRAVRVSLQQRLIGQVANGDLARMKWLGDYEASLFEGKTEKNIPDTFILDLKAAKSGLTYDALRLWISKKDYRPLWVEYRTTQGRVLKTSSFEDFGPLGGAIRARKMVVTSNAGSNDVSTMILKEMKERKFPKGFFTQTNLEKPRL